MATKTFYYKVATFLNHDGDRTLQDCLRSAYLRFPRPSQRKQSVKDTSEDDSKERNVIAYRIEHLGMECGILQHYKEGAPVLVSLHSEEDENYAMVQIPPTQLDAKKKAEFIKHLLYFAVLGNHVIFIHSPGIGSEDLESHLTWLIWKSTEKPKAAQPLELFLQDNIPDGYRDRPIHGVKSITLYSEPEVVVVVLGDVLPSKPLEIHELQHLQLFFRSLPKKATAPRPCRRCSASSTPRTPTNSAQRTSAPTEWRPYHSRPPSL